MTVELIIDLKEMADRIVRSMIAEFESNCALYMMALEANPPVIYVHPTDGMAHRWPY